MSLREFLSPEGLRLDGRRASELRRLSFQIGVLSKASVDGSAICQQGNTQVLASIIGPRVQYAKDGRKKVDSQSDSQSPINVEFSVSSFASVNDTSLPSRKQIELELLLRDSFDAMVFTELLGGSSVTIAISVLTDDGSMLACAVNAATAALIHAGIPMRGILCAISCAGIVSANAVAKMIDAEGAVSVDGTPAMPSVPFDSLMDPSQQESPMGVPIATFGLCALTGNISFVMSGGRMSVDQINQQLEQAQEAVHIIHESIKQAIKQHGSETISSLISGSIMTRGTIEEAY